MKGQEPGPGARPRIKDFLFILKRNEKEMQGPGLRLGFKV